jgi:hypothetical protein
MSNKTPTLCDHGRLGVIQRNARGRCLLCVRAYDRNWGAANKEKKADIDKRSRDSDPKRSRLKGHRKHGIVWAPGDSYELLLARTGGKCQICGRTRRLMNVDHDHAKPGVPNVRGLLCVKCNVGLGLFEDCLESLERGIAYLKGS